jgi:uncharacterized protein
MKILEKLLASIEYDAPVRQILVGAHWTCVCSRYGGLASTLTGSTPHGHDSVRDVGGLHKKSARELAELARSENPLEVSIGVAAINSLLDVDENQGIPINAGQILAEHGRGKKVALIGHFPFIPQLRESARELWVIEQRPVEGEYPASAAAELLPRADVVAITGMTLLNHTLDGLLALCRPQAMVMVLGPSTPLSPILFEYGATILSGARIIDETAALRTIGQGASFRQVQGVRLLTFDKSPHLTSDVRYKSKCS